ncbi:predicted protein, partial [Nematostella vectensis]
DRRVHDGKVSDKEHFSKTGVHNPEYDHDAFLGQDKKEFDSLTPQESKRRLGLIVDRIDKDQDGRITYTEMKEWINYAGNRYAFDDGDRLWKAIKKREEQIAKKENKSFNPDAPIDWDLYKEDAFGKTITDANEKRYQRDRKQWEVADRNKDTKLSKEEFPALFHPSVFDYMQDLVLDESMLDIDTNRDGYISQEEFLGKATEEKGTEEEKEMIARRRQEFLEHRDTNKDGRLDRRELKDYLFPAYDHVGAEAQHLINEVDKNEDGMLTKDEIMDNFEKFVGSRAAEFGQALNRHEEF